MPGRSACLACFDDAKKEGITRSKYLEALPLPQKRLLRGSVSLREEKEVAEIVSFMSKLPTKLGALTEVDEGKGWGGDDSGSEGGSNSGTPRKKKRASVRKRSEAHIARQRKEQAAKAQATEEEATRRILLTGRRVNAAQ